MKRSVSLIVFLGIFISACGQTVESEVTAVSTNTTIPPSLTPTNLATETQSPLPTNTIVPPSETPRPTNTPFPVNLNDFDECIRPKEGATNIEHWEPCQYLFASPGGKWLVIEWGANACGRSLILINAQSQEKISFDTPTAILHFFTEDEVLLNRGHCEGGTLFWENFATGFRLSLGPSGKLYWNKEETAVIVDAPTWAGEPLAWGFNFVTGNHFIPTSLNATQAVWAPDNNHVLYEVQPLVSLSEIEIVYPDTPLDSIPDPLPSYNSFFAPRRIQITNSQTGETRILLGNSETNFHLCSGQTVANCSWQEDWIVVNRVPFLPGLYFNPAADDPYYYSSKNWLCTTSMQSCPDIPEQSMLNWRSGKIQDWAILWTPTPTPHENILDD